MEWIKTLREKPVYFKKNIAFLIAFFVTIVVGGLWSFSLPARFANTEMPDLAAVVQKTETEEKPKANTLTDVLSMGSGQPGAAIEPTQETAPKNTHNDDTEEPANEVFRDEINAETGFNDSIRASTTRDTHATSFVATSTPLRAPTSTPAANSPRSSTSSIATSTKPSTPRVILIGTTTSKGTE